MYLVQGWGSGMYLVQGWGSGNVSCAGGGGLRPVVIIAYVECSFKNKISTRVI